MKLPTAYKMVHVQLCSVLDVTVKSCVGLENLVYPEAVNDALNYLMDLAFISPTLTETCGQNVLTLIIARKLKRLKMLH